MLQQLDIFEQYCETLYGAAAANVSPQDRQHANESLKQFTDDVGNLQLDKHNGLQLKVPRLGQYVSLAKSVKHCIDKEFVLFYNPSVGDVAGARLKKYVSRGWTCKSHVPNDVASRLGLSTTQLKPEAEYQQSFWEAPQIDEASPVSPGA